MDKIHLNVKLNKKNYDTVYKENDLMRKELKNM